jgi:hypothetical protein
MKILAVLALLISLCSGYQDFSYSCVANGTQAQVTGPTGTCTVTATYTDATKTLAGTFTCTGLTGNLTAAHIHICDSYSITGDSCPTSILTDCPLNLNADMASGNFNCMFADYYSMNAICADECYFNFHTEANAGGEARCNIINMGPTCNVAGAFSIDGSVVSVGPAPATGLALLPNFYVGEWATPTTGTGSGYIIVSWDSVNQTVTVSGDFTGLTSDVVSIDLNYPGDGVPFITFTSYYNFPSDYPFTFTYPIYSVWDLAKIASALTSVVVNTVNNPNGELTIAITATNFPASAAPCVPYAISAPTTTLSCNVGDSTYSTSLPCTAGYVCGISVAGVYVCTPPTDLCYNCGCNGVSTVPNSLFVCCNKDNCNLGSAASLSCVTPTPGGSGAGFIPVGFLVTLFVAVFMKWFN